MIMVYIGLGSIEDTGEQNHVSHRRVRAQSERSEGFEQLAGRDRRPAGGIEIAMDRGEEQPHATSPDEQINEIASRIRRREGMDQ